MNTIENHLLHLNQGPGANGDSRRRPRGKRGSPISPGRSSTDNARILWQFHEKITPRSGPCRRLRSPIAPGCFHRNQFLSFSEYHRRKNGWDVRCNRKGLSEGEKLALEVD